MASGAIQNLVISLGAMQVSPVPSLPSFPSASNTHSGLAWRACPLPPPPSLTNQPNDPRTRTQVARKIDFENQDILLAVRVGYVFAQLVCLAAYYYVSVSVSFTGFSLLSRTWMELATLLRVNSSW